MSARQVVPIPAPIEPLIQLKPAFCAVLNLYAEEFESSIRNPHQFNSAKLYVKNLRTVVAEVMDVLHGNGMAQYEPAWIDLGVKWAEEAGYVWKDEEEEVEA